MTANRDRQAAFRERRLSAGEAAFTIWANMGDAMALRKKYPGLRGGIDWEAVIRAALEPQAQPGGDETEQLQRKVRALERSSLEAAQQHREDIGNWRKLVDALDAKCARLEEDLRNQNPGRCG